MSLNDVSMKGLKELASYLRRFPKDDDDAEQYWYQLACVLRKRNKERFDYSQTFLVSLGQTDANPAYLFVKDLKKRNLQLKFLVECLEAIKCQPAINFFKQEASTPEILEPQGLQVRELRLGDTLRLNVESVCKPGPPQYCWFFNQEPLMGQQSRNLVISDVSMAHQGEYFCRVTNPFINDTKKCSASSKPVRVHVLRPVETVKSTDVIRQEMVMVPPTKTVWITKQPCDINEPVGSKVQLVCIGQGADNIRYTWLRSNTKDGSSCFNFYATLQHGVLYFECLSMADAGYYQCQVWNENAFALSRRVRVMPQGDEAAGGRGSGQNIRVLREPQSQALHSGSRFCLQFEVYCPVDDVPVSYQWYFSGSKISGANSNVYRNKSGLKFEECGSYWCEVRAGSECVVSQPARIELLL